MLPPRTAAQLRQLQLIWGKPPPAAEPSTLMIKGDPRPQQEPKMTTAARRAAA